MSVNSHRILARWKAAVDTTPAIDTVMGGVALLIAQAAITSNPVFDEAEIQKFKRLRRAFHPQFVQACSDLADQFESGTYGTGLQSAVSGLRAVARMTPAQDQQALVQVTRILRGLKHVINDDINPIVRRLIRQALGVDAADHTRNKYTDPEEFLKTVVKLDTLPTPVRSFIRKVVRLGLRDTPHEDTNPGAWFEMTPEQRLQKRQEYADAEAIFSQRFPEKTEDERQEVYTGAREKLQQVKREVGVHENHLKQPEAAPAEPLETVLRRESKMEVDGGSQFILQGVLKAFEESVRYQGYRRDQNTGRKYKRVEDVPIPREGGKFITLLRKAKTYDTARRVIDMAIKAQVVSPSLLEDLQGTFDSIKKNKAVKDGVPLQPLYFEPKTAEQFQADHNTGEVEFDSSVPEESRSDILGRVARAVDDLEGVFGKGFCGKHKKKLAFRFGGSAGFMAKAHYFAYDDRDPYSGQKVWQPRVTFGEDYEGVLAHELSHYFEDLIAYKVHMKDIEETGRKNPFYDSGGPGDVFGRASAGYFAEHSDHYKHLNAVLPEASELMKAVTKTPDYQRWGDILGGAYDISLGKAVEKLTGKSIYDLPKDHPYYGAQNKRYKSELPPELVAEAEKQYAAIMGGDVRKLGYYQSASEVWARMTEQYVYTKLSRRGIVNPWLTWLHYEEDVYVEQGRFETEIEPIFDRLFKTLNAQKLLAAIRRAWALGRGN